MEGKELAITNEQSLQEVLSQGTPEWLVSLIEKKATEIRQLFLENRLTREKAINNRFVINCAIDLLTFKDSLIEKNHV